MDWLGLVCPALSFEAFSLKLGNDCFPKPAAAKLSTREKLELVEQLWSDISADPHSVKVPQSHQDELVKRQGRIESGQSTFSDWAEARERIFAKVAG